MKIIRFGIRNIWRHKKQHFVLFFLITITTIILFWTKNMVSSIPTVIGKIIKGNWGDVYLWIENCYADINELEKILPVDKDVKSIVYGIRIPAFMYTDNGGQNLGIIAVDFDEEPLLKNSLPLRKGKLYKKNEIGSIVLGYYYSSALGIKPGDRISIVIGSFDGTLNSATLKVSGILGFADYAFVSKTQMENLVPGATKKAKFVKIYLESTNNIQGFLSKLVEKCNASSGGSYPINLVVSTLPDMLKNWASTFIELSNFIFSFAIIILFFGCGILIGISVFLLLHQRLKEIETYLSIGAKKFKIYFIFLAEFGVVGLVGIILGIIIGSLSFLYISSLKIVIEFGPGFDIYWWGYLALKNIIFVFFFMCFIILIWTTLASYWILKLISIGSLIKT